MGSRTDGIETMVGSGSRRSSTLRLVSVAVLFAFATVTVTMSLVTRNALRAEERSILRERTAEVATVLGTAFASVQPSLELLGTIARLDPGKPQEFIDAARAAATTGSVMVVTERAGGLTVTAAAGPGPVLGQVIGGDRAALDRRALSTKGMVSGFVRDTGALRLAAAIGGGAGPGTVVYEELVVSPMTPVPSTPTSPYRSLDIALYVAGRPDPSALVVTTTSHLPLSGITVEQPVPVGADTWSIVAGITHPLVGSLASAMPWLILVLGLLAAGLITAVVETLARRRDYASALVAERTQSLQSAITELEGAQVQLVRQERLAAVGQLASSVGHELRNPLGVIMNVLYLIEAGTNGPDGERTRRHVATARREVSAATSIVSDLLDFATGRAPISAPVEVSELVAEALSVVPAPNGITVLDLCEPSSVIQADRDQIRQVILNLISNAYDAMAGGGVLTIAASPVADGVRITVTDTGMGMDEQTRDSIFAPFFTRKARGIGLGLAVTKRIVESHNGTIAVESAPAEGSTFTLTLPGVATLAGAPR
jgi:signal transduction histidine kinase